MAPCHDSPPSSNPTEKAVVVLVGGARANQGLPGPQKLMTEPVKPGADPRNESSRSSKRQAKQVISKLQASAGVELLLLLVAAPP